MHDPRLLNYLFFLFLVPPFFWGGGIGEDSPIGSTIAHEIHSIGDLGRSSKGIDGKPLPFKCS